MYNIENKWQPTTTTYVPSWVLEEQKKEEEERIRQEKEELEKQLEKAKND